jgi:hypothetical protein
VRPSEANDVKAATFKLGQEDLPAEAPGDATAGRQRHQEAVEGVGRLLDEEPTGWPEQAGDLAEPVRQSGMRWMAPKSTTTS